MVLVQSLPRALQSGLLAKLGAASLVIYLLHPYFQGTARALLSPVVGASPYLQLGVQTLFAIAGPMVIWLLAERAALSWLFRIPLRWELNRVKTV